MTAVARVACRLIVRRCLYLAVFAAGTALMHPHVTSLTLQGAHR